MIKQVLRNWLGISILEKVVFNNVQLIEQLDELDKLMMKSNDTIKSSHTRMLTKLVDISERSSDSKIRSIAVGDRMNKHIINTHKELNRRLGIIERRLGVNND
jgi:hypothetical protein